MAQGGTILKTRKQPSAEIRVTPLRIPNISVVPQTLLIRSYSPDAYGRIRGIETVLGGKSLSTSYSYDTMHRMTKVVYGSGEETNYLYNNLGQLEGLPGILSGYISYNTAGLMAGYTYANNVDTEFSYDRSKRLTRKEYFDPAGETLSLLSLSYDAADNIIGKNGGTYRYDANNMLTEADERGAFAVNVAQKKAAGEYQDMMAAEGDYTGSLSMTFQAGEVELSLDYGSISIGVDLGDYHYVGSIEINPRETGWRVTPRQIEVYLSARNDENYYTQIKDYLYLEEEGKIILRMRKPEGARYVKVHCTFDDRDSHNNYVNLSTIANEARELITVNYLTRERLEEYSYDAKGNRTQRLTNHDGRIGTNLYTYYPNSDRIKTDGTYAYRYDANGNRTGKGTHYTDNGADIEYSALEGEVWTYRYDPFNRLTEVRKSYEGTENLELAASYSYDHRSLRVQRTDREGISTYYAYSPQGKLLSEETDNVITEYIYLGNKLAAKRTAGRTLWYSTDHLGSTVMLTDESGEIVWSEGYTAFGEASGKTGYEISESGRYTGKDYDEATGLYYYNARWYDASLGRFITEDPARDGANWYVYVRNNPLKYVDPTGLREIIDNDSSGRPEPVSPRDVKEAVREGRAERERYLKENFVLTVVRDSESYSTIGGKNKDLRGQDLLMISNIEQGDWIIIPTSSVPTMQEGSYSDSIAPGPITITLGPIDTSKYSPNVMTISGGSIISGEKIDQEGLVQTSDQPYRGHDTHTFSGTGCITGQTGNPKGSFVDVVEKLKSWGLKYGDTLSGHLIIGREDH